MFTNSTNYEQQLENESSIEEAPQVKLNWENFPENEPQKKTQVEQLLAFFGEEKLTPELLGQIVKAIQLEGETKLSDVLASKDPVGAAYDPKERKIILYPEFFQPPAEILQNYSLREYQRHLFGHEVSHGILMSGIVDFKELHDLLDPDLKDFHLGWIGSIEDEGIKTSERLTELVNCLYFQSDGTLKNALERRLQFLEPEQQEQLKTDKELLGKFVQETKRLLAFFQKSIGEGKAKPGLLSELEGYFPAEWQDLGGQRYLTQDPPHMAQKNPFDHTFIDEILSLMGISW
jgi:hypothetical protein